MGGLYTKYSHIQNGVSPPTAMSARRPSPTEIQSMGGHYIHDDYQQTPNTHVAWFRYEGRKLLLQFDVRPWMT